MPLLSSPIIPLTRKRALLAKNHIIFSLFWPNKKQKKIAFAKRLFFFFLRCSYATQHSSWSAALKMVFRNSGHEKEWIIHSKIHACHLHQHPSNHHIMHLFCFYLFIYYYYYNYFLHGSSMKKAPYFELLFLFFFICVLLLRLGLRNVKLRPIQVQPPSTDVHHASVIRKTGGVIRDTCERRKVMDIYGVEEKK